MGAPGSKLLHFHFHAVFGKKKVVARPHPLRELALPREILDPPLQIVSITFQTFDDIIRNVSKYYSIGSMAKTSLAEKNKNIISYCTEERDITYLIR